MSEMPEDEWIECEKHGTQPVGFLDCNAIGCDEGFVDESEFDCINYAPGSYEQCEECHGEGVFRVCPECCKDNPDLRI